MSKILSLVVNEHPKSKADAYDVRVNENLTMSHFEKNDTLTTCETES